MKKIYLSFFILHLSFFILHAQAPQAFNYQAIARDAHGNIISNQQIALKISIIQGSIEGQTVYAETHAITTNEFGLININIGKGKRENGEGNNLTGDWRLASGDLRSIDWSLGNYFLRIEIDPKGGSNFKEMGISQLLSVPYALYAEKTGNSGTRSGEWTHDGTAEVLLDAAYTEANVGMGTDTPGGKLHIQGVGFSSPAAPMLMVEHRLGYSSVFRRAVNNPGNALFLFQKTRGTYQSPLPVQINDNIGQLRMEGYDGSNYIEAGYMRVLVDNTVTSGSVPGALVFATTASGSGLSAERMRISSNGNVGIGVTDPDKKLHVAGEIKVENLISGKSSDSLVVWDQNDSTLKRIAMARVDDGDWTIGGDNIIYARAGWVGIGPTGPVGPTGPKGKLHVGTDKDPTPDSSMVVDDLGHVGIGTVPNPLSAFHVMGPVQIEDGSHGSGRVLCCDDEGVASWHDPHDLDVDDNDWVCEGGHIYCEPTGGVGVCTDSPHGRLHVCCDLDSNYDSSFVVSHGGEVGMGCEPVSGARLCVAGSLRLDDGTASHGHVLSCDEDGDASWVDPSGLDVDDGDWVTSGDDLYRCNSGNVGICTTSPNAKLHVNGSIMMSDGTQAEGNVLTSNASGLAAWIPQHEIDDGDWEMQGDSCFTMNLSVGVREDATSVLNGSEPLLYIQSMNHEPEMRIEETLSGRTASLQLKDEDRLWEVGCNPKSNMFYLGCHENRGPEVIFITVDSSGNITSGHADSTGKQTQPHIVYKSHPTRFKAIARGGCANDSFEFHWDIDSTGIDQYKWDPIGSTRYNLSYTSHDGKIGIGCTDPEEKLTVYQGNMELVKNDSVRITLSQDDKDNDLSLQFHHGSYDWFASSTRYEDFDELYFGYTRNSDTNKFLNFSMDVLTLTPTIFTPNPVAIARTNTSTLMEGCNFMVGTTDSPFSEWAFVVDTNDNVGIGIDHPLCKLHIVGNALVEGDLSANYFVGDGSFLINVNADHSIYSDTAWFAYNTPAKNAPENKNLSAGSVEATIKDGNGWQTVANVNFSRIFSKIPHTVVQFDNSGSGDYDLRWRIKKGSLTTSGFEIEANVVEVQENGTVIFHWIAFADGAGMLTD